MGGVVQGHTSPSQSGRFTGQDARNTAPILKGQRGRLLRPGLGPRLEGCFGGCDDQRGIHSRAFLTPDAAAACIRKLGWIWLARPTLLAEGILDHALTWPWRCWLEDEESSAGAVGKGSALRVNRAFREDASSWSRAARAEWMCLSLGLAVEMVCFVSSRRQDSNVQIGPGMP